MHTCLPFCGHNCMRYYPGERDSPLGGRGNKAYHHHSVGWNRPYRKMPPLTRPRGTRRYRESALGSRSCLLSSSTIVRSPAYTREISPFDAQLQRRRFFIRSFFTAVPSPGLDSYDRKLKSTSLGRPARFYPEMLEIVFGERKKGLCWKK